MGGDTWGKQRPLLGPLPPGGILNWNAQNNQSHGRQTDVERSPTGWGGIIFLSYREITAADTSPVSPSRFIEMQMLFCRLEWSHYLCSGVKKKERKKLQHHYPVNLLPTSNWDDPPIRFGQSGLSAARLPSPEPKTLGRNTVSMNMSSLFCCWKQFPWQRRPLVHLDTHLDFSRKYFI